MSAEPWVIAIDVARHLFTGETTLKGIDLHRLAALVLGGLQSYAESAISNIHKCVGGEIHPKQVKRALEESIKRGAVRFVGNNPLATLLGMP